MKENTSILPQQTWNNKTFHMESSKLAKPSFDICSLSGGINTSLVYLTWMSEVILQKTHLFYNYLYFLARATGAGPKVYSISAICSL